MYAYRYLLSYFNYRVRFHIFNQSSSSSYFIIIIILSFYQMETLLVSDYQMETLGPLFIKWRHFKPLNHLAQGANKIMYLYLDST